ncbi:anoctamin-5-like [Watersipora subatra]|uniref:anoctamin-5-like n=1 Tax=Watersipora subatra TaxID=2589382 RepID=UPI00355C9AB3
MDETAVQQEDLEEHRTPLLQQKAQRSRTAAQCGTAKRRLVQPETTYFRDGVRRIDFVLVYDKKRSRKPELRESFQNNLLLEGLELEVEPAHHAANERLVFIKIHLPWEVLTRYAEMTGMLMPMIVNDIEIAARSRRKSWIRVKGGYRLTTSCLDMYPTLLRLVAWVWRAMLPDSALREPTPYYVATYNDVGICKLLNMKVYSAAFPLHDGPVDLDPGDPYIDSRVFATVSFLGFYTAHLIFPSILGIITFIIGVTTISSANSPSHEICGTLGRTIMCPSCDQSCDYWRLSDSCFYSRLTYLFDNFAIVGLAIAASIWPNLFMCKLPNTLH